MGGNVHVGLIRRLFSLCCAVAVILTYALPQPAYAFETNRETYLNGGYYHSLVSDSNFIDINSMSVAEIQAFLVSKGSALATAPPDRLGNGANGRSAAQIIWDAARGYGEASGSLKGINITNATVSPKVLLVTLQKEMSLITYPTLEDNRLRVAMGYGCPDGAACDARYYGFAHQVEWAAWQLRYNYEIAGKDAAWWSANYGSQNPYYKGYSRSHGWADGGSTTYYIVNYKNQATASLYRYTPHVGFGNFNFWRLMIDWFQASPVNIDGQQLQINDTEPIVKATYKSRIKGTGTKTSDTRAYWGSQLIADLGTTSWSIEFEPSIGNKDYHVIYRNSSGTQVASKKFAIDRRKVGDVNGDQRVDLLDVSLISNAWGQNVQDDASLNLNPETDSVVDLLDISLLAANFEG